MTNEKHTELSTSHGKWNEPPILIYRNFGSEVDASAVATDIAQALEIVGFRGSVIFKIHETTNNNTMVSLSSVTFTDDMPRGIWNTSHI